MLGGYIWQLEAGDVFEPVEYELTTFMVASYSHGVEEDFDWYHSADSPYGQQIRNPAMAHMEKMLLLEKNCPKGPGDQARIHYEFHAKQHSAAFVGERLVVSGRLTERYVKRGREFINYELETRTTDGRLVSTYRDKTLLRYRPVEEKTNG